MDVDTFERLARARRFRPQTLEIARRRVLGGERAMDLAIAYGVNVQRIYGIERQIQAAAAQQRLPPGWAEATIVAPEALLREFQARAAAARAELTGAVERPRGDDRE